MKPQEHPARLRDAMGPRLEHRFTTSDAEFDAITKYFVSPAREEGFNIVEE